MLIGFVMTRSVRKTAIMVVLLAAAAAAMLYAGSFSREAAEVYAAALTEPHATASATAVNMKEGSWVYSSYADSDGQVYASVTGYDGNALTLDIPGTLGGLTVRAIGREAFCGSRYLTAVTIPEGVTEIGKYAFQGCVGLQNVTVPSTLRNIGEGAFYGHDDFNVVAGIDPPPDNKTVDPGHPRESADIGRDHKVENADALVTFHAQFPQHPVQFGYLKTFLVMNQPVIPLRHDKGNKLGKTGKRAQQTSFFPITHASA